MGIELAWGTAAAGIEDRLAVRAGAGEGAAFDEIVERYHLRLFRFALRLLRDRSEAEDAVQETFVRVYRALPSYRPDGYFSSWIYRVALNECRRRMRCRRPTVPLEFAPHLSTGNEPEIAALTGDRNRRLREAVASLPEHYRLVMSMFYFDELAVDQISRALDVSVSAVKVRLHRGRDRLANKLDAQI
jgi:RNA polymerase sigma-70 factor (ECF subfamily)